MRGQVRKLQCVGQRLSEAFGLTVSLAFTQRQPQPESPAECKSEPGYSCGTIISVSASHWGVPHGNSGYYWAAAPIHSGAGFDWFVRLIAENERVSSHGIQTAWQ